MILSNAKESEIAIFSGFEKKSIFSEFEKKNHFFQTGKKMHHT
jgi:hypothetical protein